MSTVVVLNNDEDFIKFLDPDLFDITVDEEIGSLRTINVSYYIQELEASKELFRMGNKIWIQGYRGINDGLFVINTPVTQDLFSENKFSFDAEDVLVELNYAPFFTQTDLKASNGFNITTTNGEQSVKINWNALNFWFGDYFNIGIVQDCLSNYAQKVTLSGTMSLMSLLRYIEEQTGNYFVTRYEKDVLNNTIHRYLDFLNPVSINKNWELNLEYDFQFEENYSGVFDDNDDPTTDDDEDVEDEDDIVTFDENAPVVNINPENILFRITKDNEVLTSNTGDLLQWAAADIGFSEDTPYSVITLKHYNNRLSIKINEMIFSTMEESSTGIGNKGYISVADDSDADYYDNVTLPNHSVFEMYDYIHNQVVFQHTIYPILGDVHDDVLDLAYNVENIKLELDETDTFNAITPVLSLGDNSSTGLSRTELNKVINDWINLEVEQGDIIPMIVQKVTLTKAQKDALGTMSVSSNYYARPLKPQDNIDSSTPANSTYEYFRATAYWQAPFSKRAGELHVQSEKETGAEYTQIRGRPDTRDSRATFAKSKMGSVETSDENKYAIYNAVAMKLKDKLYPEFDIDVDVANLKGGLFNDYNIHDKVYIKLPGGNELITAKVDKTSKNLVDMGSNTVGLSNYSVNQKTIPTTTIINSTNASFKYPNKQDLSATLVDADDNPIPGKLLTFTLYKVENNSATLTGTVYTKKTNSAGVAKISMKYDPGDYEIAITFGGDEEYLESAFTVEVNVGGVKETSTQTNTQKTSTKSKTVAKTSKKKYKTVKTYWSKCGKSPDKKHKEVIAIAQPSAGDANRYHYHQLYKTVFKNKCPYCGKVGTLTFDYHKKGCVGKNIPENEITCDPKKGGCDCDFCGVTGLEKDYNPHRRLTTIKKPVKSSKSELAKLIKGKLVYGTKKVKVKSKKKTSKKTRTVKVSGISKSVKNKALSIVGDSKGISAAKKIAKWCGTHIKYDYYTSFSRSPAGVLKKGKGNCCDQTRLMLTMMDAAGCTEFIDMSYVYVCCGPKNVGHIFSKLKTKESGKWRYVDPCKKDPWGHHVTGWGRPPGRQTSYPSRPF